MTPLSITLPILVIDDTQAHMDMLKQRVRHMRVSNGVTSLDDFDGTPTTNLPPNFVRLEVESYTSRGCLYVHLRLYVILMRTHRLDETQMLMLFPMSLSGVA